MDESPRFLFKNLAPCPSTGLHGRISVLNIQHPSEDLGILTSTMLQHDNSRLVSNDVILDSNQFQANPESSAEVFKNTKGANKVIFICFEFLLNS